ncbi:MAG: 3'(2'),5'-bisphosphate nucleotidase CysQ [Actinobacteria bacterium]|jgi:3'(2'), 5'-bisphosphate nucleotidase|nr:3'(2'),5'-bisphosphate nucleotidase CysQ [Actinomycetota bacterium]MBT3746665.1 3'(2'),5'-bisphosphate nucleotidase CysQ [Actinomycetota bacterium]MBT3968891.1 3'(2'),5'-bisphosphate nucleotidase CysQ [Actinomycetota bacterium]MBT4010444.1 3'(2'),5'-bisphosphate nucleotidase CysQ [Actinomycetota bacterium]MBT4302513.1 3'(2'),5'-bisphosphate nucleotidase CysQ [Actinomycetota bacterium]
MEDHEVAGLLARETGELLVKTREEAQTAGRAGREVQALGDRVAHEFLIERLSALRPGDAVLSEEGADDGLRLGAERTWIIDPLDGTHDYGRPGSSEWAVHVALVVGGTSTAAAVSLPVDNQVFGTNQSPLGRPSLRQQPVVITSRSQWGEAEEVARAIGGVVRACGSAGYKAMAVVSGLVDVYVHPSGLYEWDACAPAAVAQAAGLSVSGVDGQPLHFNKRRPVVAGLLISRPEFAEVSRQALAWE